ncbi:hypothetical protein GJ496_000123 [Pomphorhynchus laevis]|nr:hypothetical protein GJ496_000123 [Pomphorhynchus laevis]
MHNLQISPPSACNSINEAFSLNAIYDLVILWRPNLLRLLRCNASHDFVDMVAQLIDRFSNVSLDDTLSLKLLAVMCQLVLQNTYMRRTTVVRKILDKRIRD